MFLACRDLSNWRRRVIALHVLFFSAGERATSFESPYRDDGLCDVVSEIWDHDAGLERSVFLFC